MAVTQDVAATYQTRAQNHDYVPRHIVVHEDPGTAAERGTGLDVPPQEAFEGLIEGEDGVDRPRVRQHEDQGGERPDAASDAIVPKLPQSTCATSPRKVVSLSAPASKR